MKRIFFYAFFVFVLLLPWRNVSAQQRYATCDACGYCPEIVNGAAPACTPVTPPGNWKNCVTCLYNIPPSQVDEALQTCKTLKVHPTNGVLAIIPGRQYTMLGCITSTGGFQNDKGSGASSFVQALFDFLVFRITGGIALLYLMYGAFIILSSQSDPQRLNYGRRVVYGAVIGLVFVFGSVFIVNIIGSGILKIPGFSSP